MATKTIVTCDLHNDGLTAALATTFAVDGDRYQLDLCETHLAELRAAVGPFVAVATPVSGGRSRATRTARESAPPKRRPDLAEIRAWARDKGYEVSDRGRIPAAIVEEFDSSSGRRTRKARS